jgi:uncharacterized protein (DUF486 family)
VLAVFFTITQFPSNNCGKVVYRVNAKALVKGSIQYTVPVGAYLISVFFLAVDLTLVERMAYECLL